MIKRKKHRAITNSLIVFAEIIKLEETIHFFFFYKNWQSPGLLRRFQQSCRINLYTFITKEKPIKGTKSCHIFSNISRSIPPSHLFRHPQTEFINTQNIPHTSPVVRDICQKKIRSKGQSLAISDDCTRQSSALRRLIGQKIFHPLLHFFLLCMHDESVLQIKKMDCRIQLLHTTFSARPHLGLKKLARKEKASLSAKNLY